MQFTRRGFIGGLIAAAAVHSFPFRVFSFPNKIVLPWASRTRMFVSRDGVKFIELPGVEKVTFDIRRRTRGQALWTPHDGLLRVEGQQSLITQGLDFFELGKVRIQSSTGVEVEGSGMVYKIEQHSDGKFSVNWDLYRGLDLNVYQLR